MISRIAIGSCSDQKRPQELWPVVLANNPDLWIWLGDNIYADTEDMRAMDSMYQVQKTDPVYQQLIRKARVVGIWDDHDYGLNDGGKEFGPKAASRDLMLKFLDVPQSHPVWKRQGGYQSYTFGSKGKTLKVILLDARYFRDELRRSTEPNKRYETNENGDILGEAQWKWLEKELKNNKALLTLIGSGIQILPNEQIFEKWGHFPKARKRLLDLLAKHSNQNIVLLSGDRHIAELSKTTLPGAAKPLYEFTSSGLTHTWSSIWEESNQYRVEDLVIAKNFGMILIDWESKPLTVTFEARGLENKCYWSHKAAYPPR